MAYPSNTATPRFGEGGCICGELGQAERIKQGVLVPNYKVG